ncbi:ABC transporter permease [Ornithinimicrobium tianjinense]|uniref:ABC-2 family transporter protein n=1 Tax=Ornithinimicrobium tianjinense TaxID=1195761 RepID=A0A917BDQ8_9MICO|nr:ABC transporter permease [Ornithinimicrobium tianjinense]GGF36679.1 hypothetical protein GCM10011366_00360 [Ornithinimicrobium tianjinense]
MSATSELTRPGAPGTGATAYLPQIEDVPALSFTRLVGVELRKLVDTRTGRWLLITILLLTAAVMAVTLWIGRQDGTGLFALLTAANIPQAVLLPVLGVITAANEWSQRTALVTFTQEPRRLRVMGAKTVAVVLLGLAILLVTVLLAVVAHVVSMTRAGGEVDLWHGWSLVVGAVVLQTLGVLMGVAFGTLLLNVPLGIVLYFLTPTVASVLVVTTSWLREHAAWFELGTAQLPLIGDGWMTGEQWAQLGTTSALWIGLPLAIGCWRVARREVK